MTSETCYTSCDTFLGGQLKIWQPRQGYRAGIDPVLLAAAVSAKSGESLLDLGCGVGVAALCAARRIPGLQVSGLELQPENAALAQRNGAENEIDFDVTVGDLAQLPQKFKDRQYHHVIANPPYFDRAHGQPAARADRETAMGEQTPLATWVKIAAQRTRPKGFVTFILRVERLPEFLGHAVDLLGSLQVLPLIPAPERPPNLVLIQGRRDGKAAFRLLHGWVLHTETVSGKSANPYTNATNSVLRHGEALNCFS